MDAFLVRSNLCGLAALAFFGGSYHDHFFLFLFLLVNVWNTDRNVLYVC